jgi:GWxTD domain-containing protein
MKHAFGYLIVLLVITISCSAPKSTLKTSAVNLSNMYNPTNTSFYPAYTVYHNLQSTTLLLVKIFPGQLLYTGTIEPGKLVGQVSFSYQLDDITDSDKTSLADSGIVTYKFARDNADKRFLTQIPLKTEIGKRYHLTILAKDLVRNEEKLDHLYVDRSSDLSEQNFMLLETNNKTPIFQPYVVGNTVFKINYSGAEHDSVFVKFYRKETPLPKPSFSMSREIDFFEKPDSIWILPFGNNTNYQLNYKGIYHFQLDTSVAEGLTLYNFGDNYPRVQEAVQLFEPLAYLTTTSEYKDIQDAKNLKLAIDNFWLDKAGNMEKARELIKIYYNRVYFSNYFFTSLKPGWKTDRGMIFIIYGPPQAIKVTTAQEKWVYYKNNFTTTVTFTFDHKPTPFSSDNYILQRSDSYDTYWRTAVDTWRKGEIYLIE